MSEHPSRLGKYEIRRELGSGAMGVVYEAFDPTIERIVALKTIRRDQVEGAEAADAIARFQREAKAAGRLNHPNIVAIYEFGEDASTMFIAMEFVAGRELRSYFEGNERFEMKEIVRIMGQLLDALDYSHINGVVHRDIKPANIIILPDGQVKVADFGIARIESSQYTQAGTVLGTPAYMSPEQFMGQIVDGRSDIFSAGVVLYQFLTGERPFTGGATTIMHKVLNEHPPAPSMLSVQVPKLFDAVISKAMEKRPDDRFEIARQFKQAIILAAEGRGGPELDQLLGAGSEATIVNSDSLKTVKTTADAPTVRQPPPVGDGGWRSIGGGSGGGSGGGQPPASASTPQPAAGASTGNPGGAAAAPVAAKSASRKSPLLILGGLLLALLVVGGAIAVMLARSLPHAELDKAADAMVRSLEKEAQQEAPGIVGGANPTEPGTMLISAVGLADPGDKKYQSDKALLNSDLRADSKGQLIEKAIALYLDRTSLDKNYALLRDRLMAKSSGYILNIVSESEPQLGKDGLMHVTTQATVKVRDVQKSLNDMARDERIEFIRNNGDPRISVSINVRGEGVDAPAQNSQVAENLLKERIKSFGFRVVSGDAQAQAALGKDVAVAALDDIGMKKLSANLAKSGVKLDKLIADGDAAAGPPGKGADFAVVGEARIKKLSVKLPASGITVEKYLLTSWTVKCIDTQSGEEIYYNNKLPVAAGSWATEEQALAAIGGKIADEFSRDFFLQHFAAGGQQVTLNFEGLPDQAFQQAVARELVGLEQVINLTQRGKGEESAMFDLNLSGSGPLNDLVAGAVLKPLNAKLGKPCFDLGAIAGNRISVKFDKACGDPAVIARFDVNPPASLYEAPSVRQNWVLKDPNAVKRLSM
jgi:eukaryotic-like serine/threonine-protein kinase